MNNEKSKQKKINQANIISEPDLIKGFTSSTPPPKTQQIVTTPINKEKK
jgi:hypothetical protein